MVLLTRLAADRLEKAFAGNGQRHCLATKWVDTQDDGKEEDYDEVVMISGTKTRTTRGASWLAYQTVTLVVILLVAVLILLMELWCCPCSEILGPFTTVSYPEMLGVFARPLCIVLLSGLVYDDSLSKIIRVAMVGFPLQLAREILKDFEGVEIDCLEEDTKKSQYLLQ